MMTSQHITWVDNLITAAGVETWNYERYAQEIEVDLSCDEKGIKYALICRGNFRWHFVNLCLSVLD